MRTDRLTHRFVELAPATLEDATLYISIAYDAAIHLCCCGCGSVVMTPLSQRGWSLTYNGTVSLQPSIGNGSYPCRSHYWIKSNQVRWLSPVSDAEIESARSSHRIGPTDPLTAASGPAQVDPAPQSGSWFGRAMRWLLRRP